MRLLLDTCVSGKSATALRESGHDVEWAGDWPADPGDAAIIGEFRERHRCSDAG